jgi:hypothetical protein
MSTWEERMAARTRARADAEVQARRRAYLGDVFLEFYPPDEGREYGFQPQVEISPEIIAANCLGITYGDPGPLLGGEICHQCWGDRHVWLGNCWGLRHTGGTMNGCRHECHADEVWLATSA